jgi:hypothetical protein
VLVFRTVSWEEERTVDLTEHLTLAFCLVSEESFVAEGFQG